MKKYITHIPLTLVLIWLVGSVTLSAVISIDPDRGYNLLEHRAPFLMVEIATGQVIGFDDDAGQLYGIANGAYVGYGYIPSAKPGDTITSFFVYNPLNNYFDDIVERFDIDPQGNVWRA